MKNLPAIALIEFSGIAAGAYAADRMVKRSPIELLRAGTVQPGKYLILIGGGTAEVEESYREGMQAAPDNILDEVLLPQVHRQVVEALDGQRMFGGYESLAILETSTIAAIIRSTDAAAKGAMVEVAEMRIGNGLGGRGIAVLTGDRTDVEAAADLAARSLAGRNVTLCHSIISNVHKEFASLLGESSRFFGRK
ncbi:MAG TPA: BMC domain-containing protein [Lacipirellulaceae bacterium]|nr:BMC domain-containing protein [Lacipirellulaceae bacterium]